MTLFSQLYVSCVADYLNFTHRQQCLVFTSPKFIEALAAAASAEQNHPALVLHPASDMRPSLLVVSGLGQNVVAETFATRAYCLSKDGVNYPKALTVIGSM